VLSQTLIRHFAAIGARLRVKTAPKRLFTQLALGIDDLGEYFELQLPRCSRHGVQILEIVPREQRLLLQCGESSKRLWRVQRKQDLWTLSSVPVEFAKPLPPATNGLSLIA
jgi:hypothetical protein